ncbi:MAG: bifunctional tetrahydrofolate synthase/dihydrofolate synthase [Candidatus Zixiibacteriota bacterium]
MNRPALIPYREAVRRLYSLERWGIKLGLDNIQALCNRLGHPERKVPSVHIAGTNGKGSVTAMLEAMCLAAGYSVGRYTSPHLRDLRERIHINGKPIPRGRVRRFLTDHWTTIHRERYSYFETVTAMAFDAFASCGCDLAMIEVGLGGRFDATNVLHPELSIITNIDLDHERTLGRTLNKIAFEKAGIIKPGTPVLLGDLPEVAVRRISRVADRIGAPVFRSSEVLAARRGAHGESLTGLRWRVPLPGAHQRHNFGVALAAVVILDAAGIRVPLSRAAAGVRRTNWPARFQIESGAPTIIYDVAHNPSGMREFVRTWRNLIKRDGVMVFTAREDKKYQDMWQDLATVSSQWIGCPLPHSPGIDRSEMERLARKSKTPFVWTDTPRQAVSLARRMAGPDGVVGVVGSHYLIGEILPVRLLSARYRSPVTQELTQRDIILSTSSR